MTCPYCREEMSNTSESQVLKEGNRSTPWTDANGSKCLSGNRYVDGIIVVYECDGPKGCESEYQWSSKTRQLTLVKGAVEA